MARKKSNLGKIVLSLAGLLIVGGAAATVTAGFLTDWSFNQTDVFKDVVIESQEIAYDGTAHSLAIKLPEGATYKLTITNSDGEVVSEAKDIGVYTFNYDVTIDNTTKTFTATLTIKDESELETKVEAKGLQLRVLSVNTLANGDIVKTLNYSVEPADTEQTLTLVSILKGGQDASSFVTCDINSLEKTITLTCKQAFDQQIIVTLSHSSAKDVRATITCDYKKKALSCNFSIDEQLDGGHIATVEGNNAIYLDPYYIYSNNQEVVWGMNASINYSIGTIEADKVYGYGEWVADYQQPADSNQYLESTEFFNYFKINVEDENFTFKEDKTYWSYVTNIVYGLPNHYLKLGYIDYKIGDFTNRVTIALKSTQNAVNSINVSNSVIF